MKISSYLTILFLSFSTGIFSAETDSSSYFVKLSQLKIGEEVEIKKNGESITSVKIQEFSNGNLFTRIKGKKISESDILSLEEKDFIINIDTNKPLTANQLMFIMQLSTAAKKSGANIIIDSSIPLNEQKVDLPNYDSETNGSINVHDILSRIPFIDSFTVNGIAAQSVPKKLPSKKSMVKRNQNIIIAGSKSHPELAREVYRLLLKKRKEEHLDSTLSIEFLDFSKPELLGKTSLEGKNVFLIGSPSMKRDPNPKRKDENDVNDNIIQLFSELKYLKEKSSAKIYLNLGYIPYARSDKDNDQSDDTIIGHYTKMALDLLLSINLDSLKYTTAHAAQTGGFLPSKTSHKEISGHNILANYFKETLIPRLRDSNITDQYEEKGNGIFIVAPDVGAQKDTEKFIKRLNKITKIKIPFLQASKVRNHDTGELIPGETNITCKDKGATYIIIDDETASGSTLNNVAKVLKDKCKAREVIAAVIHLNGKAKKVLSKDSSIDKLYVTDSFPIPQKLRDNKKLIVVSIASAFTNEIFSTVKHISENKALKTLNPSLDIQKKIQENLKAIVHLRLPSIFSQKRTCSQ